MLRGLKHDSTTASDTGEVKFEGRTSFESSPGPFYRYSIALKDNKMSIWMEDSESKKQWFKGGMEKGDYVTTDNTITGASVADYLEFFQEALVGAQKDSSDSYRRLSILKAGALDLKFILKLRVLHSAWEATFAFQLDPVSIERIDILESKLRDQEDELRKIDVLESKLREQEKKLNNLQLRDASTSNLVEFRATGTFSSGSQKIRWTGDGSIDLVVNNHNGKLIVRRPGVYVIEAAVKGVADAEDDEDEDYVDCDSTDEEDKDEVEIDSELDEEDEIESDDDEDQAVSLLKNGECIRVDFFTDECSIASPMAITRLKDGDELMVTSTCKLEGTSTLFIVCIAG
ncbi:hypothetical protein PHYPSEUDO_003672 [Phytophthora pseudosyringae]|uniref:Uncharacterized protein n=1 Tax=Phytophthora pseudosyringae TaxID=221518 RepID=A0A8T1VPZ3_9STRA|nr:hypothetical protein PHYPSEUDO_003672 [Phytophthora pseudosyringae]